MQKQMHFGFKLIAPESSYMWHWKKRMHPANYVASALDREQGVLQVEYTVSLYFCIHGGVLIIHTCVQFASN